MIREEVLAALSRAPGDFISGGDLAAGLGVTRSAVWKAVSRLRQEGWPIESVPRKGHRLNGGHDVLSAEGIRRFLTRPGLDVRFYPVISSTNTVLKQLALEDAPEGLALVAGSQTAGRGRLGRSFYSPSGSGIYLSLLLRPSLKASEAVRFTACAAVAAAEAIESLADVRVGIKWVNDLFLGGRKVCGILTEAGLDLESGRLSYMIVGIGINTRVPAGDFPEDIRDTAGAVFGDAPVPDLRNRLAAGVLDRLMAYSARPDDPALFESYRRRSVVLGRPIRVLEPGKEPLPAEALELAPDYSLRVRMADGSVRLLHSGEISIRF